MRRGKQRSDGAPPAEPVVDADRAGADAITGSWPAPDAVQEADPYVEGEAVELAGESPPVPGSEPPAIAVPVPPAYEPQIHETPVYVPPAYVPDSTPGGGYAANVPGGDAAQRLWSQLPVDPAERPEILVGAAFGGGLLIALILRRLGH